MAILIVGAGCADDGVGVAGRNNSRIDDAGVDGGDDAGGPDVGDPDSGTNNGGDDGCDGDADCTVAGEICVFDPATGSSTCGAPVGGGETGDACSSGEDCAAGLCLNGACAEPCGGESDCPSGFTCQNASVPLSGGGATSIDVCVPEPSACLSNSDCVSPEVCVVDRTVDPPTATCGAAVGGGGLGESCSADADCASNLCIDGACSALCEVPNDCTTDGTYRCETVDGLNVCVPKPEGACLADAECTTPQRCVAQVSSTDVEFVCGAPNAGGAELGGACSADVDCAQNLCVDGLCTGPCQGNGDCAAATDYSCELTPVPVSAGGTDNAQICAPPVICQENDACKVNETCYFRSDANGIDTICRAPNVAGGGLGQVCAGSGNCASNLCLETRFRDVCTVACVDDNDCDRAGYSCQQRDIEYATDMTESVGVCAPSTPPTCTSPDDCATGRTCVIVENIAGDGLEAVCLPSTGGDANGVVCLDDDDCASLVCLEGFCASPCDDAGQCVSDQVCESNEIDKAGLTGNFQVCETLGDQSCASSDDCTDGTRVCGEIRSAQNPPAAYCVFPNAGADPLGTACGAGSECRENICLSVSGECSVICADDGDCGQGQICTTYGVGTGEFGFCNSSCLRNADCTLPDTICTINGDTLANDIDLVCQETVGATGLGGTCASAVDCITGLCLTTAIFTDTACTTDTECTTAHPGEAGILCRCPLDQPNCTSGKLCATEDKRCTRVCNDNGDCSGGETGNELTACSAETYVTLPDKTGAKQISTCAQP